MVVARSHPILTMLNRETNQLKGYTILGQSHLVMLDEPAIVSFKYQFTMDDEPLPGRLYIWDRFLTSQVLMVVVVLVNSDIVMIVDAGMLL